MKTSKAVLFLTMALVLIFLTVVNAQEIPNNSFENWSGGDPVDWQTSDSPGLDAVSQSSDAYEGDSSVFMQILDAGQGLVVTPDLQVTDGFGGIGTPVTQRYNRFSGYYKFTKNGNEWFNVQISMQLNGNQIGSAASPFDTAGNWKEFSLPIVYTSSETPDRAIILMFISDFGGQGVVGTNGFVDYVMFEAPNYIEQFSGLPEDFNLKQNYPNPFNPATNIEYSIPEASFVQLKVYDLLGNEVTTLVSKKQSVGVYEVVWDGTDAKGAQVASGVYIYRLNAGNPSAGSQKGQAGGAFIESRKMLLVR